MQVGDVAISWRSVAVDCSGWDCFEPLAHARGSVQPVQSDQPGLRPGQERQEQELFLVHFSLRRKPMANKRVNVKCRSLVPWEHEESLPIPRAGG